METESVILTSIITTFLTICIIALLASSCGTDPDKKRDERLMKLETKMEIYHPEKYHE